ncbi:MAG: YjbH domain-containing protein [Epsilonproteobacteria bacterium]|nr:YjbH domain-containing protein [Campylobacterota bacterium]
MFKYFYLASLSFCILSADSFSHSTSYQGYTGIINIPTAEVIEDSKVEFQISNQVDATRVRDSRDEYTAQHYFVNFGFLPNLEITGRLANIEYKNPPGQYDFLDRDLSASFKYQIPFYHKYLPKLAFGMQDVGGDANRYQAKYIVATKQYAFFRGTVGFGFGSDRLDGFFAGAELKANDWFYLLTEYDSQESHLGLKVTTPTDFFKFGQISFMAKTNLDDKKDKTSLALNFKINLGIKHHSIQEYKEPSSTVEYIPTPVTNNSIVVNSNTIELLKEKLVNFGFENIDIGDTPSKIYVAYENNIFDHNEIDALGAILGYMVELDLPYHTFEIVIKKSNLKVKKVLGDLDKYKRFIKDLSERSLIEFDNSLRVNTNFTDTPLKVQNANSSYFKTRVELGFGLKSLVGTEIGLYDYLLSARPYIHWNLYKGFDLGIMYDLPFLKSENFKDGKPFARYDEGNQLDSMLLHYSSIFGNFINILSLGLYEDQTGGFDNISYTYNNHTFRLKLGYLKDQDTDDTKNITLATYRYYDPHYDAIVELTGGTYYNQDNGFDLQLKRYFGETLIRLFYQNTTAEYIGIGFELPLTPRRVADNRYIQFKGSNDFSYQIRSVVRSDDSVNALKPGGARNPDTGFEIEDRFLNRNRLTESYIRKHILRLRDVYFTYISNEKN